MYYLLFFIPLFASLDRIRGSSLGIGKTPETLIYGFAVSYLLFDINPVVNILFSISFLAGASIGWGQPIGWLISGNKTENYEFWQIGILRNNRHLAVFVRGLLWSLPTSIIFVFNSKVVDFIIVMPIAFYLAAVTTHYLVKYNVKYAWEFHEVIRGALLGIGLLCLILLNIKT